MKFLIDKTGLALVLLVGIFVFVGVGMSGVFGNTQIGLTLFSNTDLDSDIVGHYSFDTGFEQGVFGFGNGGTTTVDFSTNIDFVRDVAIDDAGYLYVTGFCNGCGSAGSYAFVTYKLDPVDGSTVWSTTTDPGPNFDTGLGIDVDSLGDVYVTGLCDNNACASGGDAHYTIKIDGDDGDLIWATTTDPSTGIDSGEAIAVDSKGNVFVAGFCNGCGSLGGDAYYIYKVNPDSGAMIWATTTDPSNSSDRPSGIITDNDGGMYVTGHCGSCGGGSSEAYHTVKFSTDDGSLLWSTTTDSGTSGFQRSDGIAMATSGALYVTGYCTNCGGLGGRAHYTIKIDANSGDFLWGTTTDLSSVNDEGNGVVATEDGDVYVTGYCDGCGTNGNEALYTYKLGLGDGSIIWATTTDVTSGEDLAERVVVGRDGGVYVVGSCDGCSGVTNDGHYIMKLNPDDGSFVSSAEAGAIRLYGAETAPGNIGQGVQFDGLDNYAVANVNHDFSSSNLTITAWVKADTINQSDQNTFLSQSGATDQFQFEIDGENQECGNDALRFNIFEGGTSIPLCGITNIVPDQWYHTAISINFTDDEAYIYLNGEVDVASTTFLATMDTAIEPLYVGGTYNNPVSQLFDGMVDDVRIFNRVLSAEEISRLYGLGATTKINTTITTNPNLERGLVGHWTFDGTDVDRANNQIIDRSEGGNHGTTTGMDSATTTAPGTIGQGFDLDGVDDFVNVSDVPILEPSEYTLTAWIKPRVHVDYARVMAHGDSSAGIMMAFGNLTSNNKMRCLNYDGDFDVVVHPFDLDVSGDTWYHVTCVKDASSITIFINGESSASLSSGSPQYATGEYWRFGNDLSGAGYFFDGVIDDVRIYDRALSTSTIQRLYGLGATTKINTTITTNSDLERGLVSHWTFDGKDRDTASSTGEVHNRTRSLNGDMQNYTLVQDGFVPGVIGQALATNGVDEYVVVPQDSALEGFSSVSIAAWVNPQGPADSSWSHMVIKDYLAEADYGLLFAGNDSVSNCQTNDFVFRIEAATELNLCSTESYAVDGDWHYLVGTWDGSVATLYIDGTFATSGNLTGTLVDRDQNFVIGGNEGASDRYFDGYLDDVRVYDRTLSADEVLRLYQLGQ